MLSLVLIKNRNSFYYTPLNFECCVLFW